MMFNLAPRSRVTEQEMQSVITRYVHENFKEDKWPAPESVNRDVDCLVKMYASDQEFNPLSPGSFEDLLMAPFRELGLLEGQGEGSKRPGASPAAPARTCQPPCSPTPVSTMPRVSLLARARSLSPGWQSRKEPRAVRSVCGNRN